MAKKHSSALNKILAKTSQTKAEQGIVYSDGHTTIYQREIYPSIKAGNIKMTVGEMQGAFEGKSLDLTVTESIKNVQADISGDILITCDNVKISNSVLKAGKNLWLKGHGIKAENVNLIAENVYIPADFDCSSKTCFASGEVKFYSDETI
jgi:hypothetical protein